MITIVVDQGMNAEEFVRRKYPGASVTGHRFIPLPEYSPEAGAFLDHLGIGHNIGLWEHGGSGSDHALRIREWCINHKNGLEVIKYPEAHFHEKIRGHLMDFLCECGPWIIITNSREMCKEVLTQIQCGKKHHDEFEFIDFGHGDGISAMEAAIKGVQPYTVIHANKNGIGFDRSWPSGFFR